MPFQNPVVAGETLVVPAIQSEGFVSGSTGWRIERDGDAEFNDVDIRGELTVSNADGEVFIGPGGAGVGPTVRATAADGVRVSLDSFFGGVSFTDIDAGAGSAQVNYDEQTGSPAQDWLSLYLFGGSGETTQLKLTDESGTGLVFVSHPIKVRVPGTPSGAYAPEEWNTATLQNSWSTVGVTAFHAPAYMMDATGRVWLRGVAANGTIVNGTTVFTLPAEYQPVERKQMPVTLNAGTTLTAVIQVMEIGSGTAGQVKIYGVPAGNAIGFDGVSFDIDT